MNQLQHISLTNFISEKGIKSERIQLSYEVFGKALHTAPIILVNHALTGNSNVAGENGWWIDLVGENRVIDTNQYTVLSFNIPGNGYDGFVIENYKDFEARDIANIFLLGLKELKIEQLFALIGGSLGGGIAWEMAVINPVITKNLIVIATDWKSTDWLIANCQIQEQFLVNSCNPVHDARMHAMLCYRTPESFKARFQRSKNKDLEIFNVESWLLHHGKKLQERFQLSAYKLMNQLLRSIDVTKGRDESILDSIQANIHIIGVDSDLFFTAEENKETHKQLALTHPNVTYNEINSVHGHDAFLMEYKQLGKIIEPIFNQSSKKNTMKVVKFGGQSLANGKGLDCVLDIIETKINNGESIAVVISARGKTTDHLDSILEKAKNNLPYLEEFEKVKNYQLEIDNTVDVAAEFQLLDEIFRGVNLLGDYSPKVKDQVLAQGEILSGKVIVHLLKKRGLKANFVDSRKLIKTNNQFGSAQPFESVSEDNVVEFFRTQPVDTTQIITGFIGSTLQGETTTLGRNGSNYTASLIANFLNAEEFQNYTHVDGIYTANPELVENSKKIEKLSYQEANEMANFGANILHAKTIIPLIEKNIPLRILNTFNADSNGTLIGSETERGGIKSLSVDQNVALVNLIGRGLLGKVGVDGRIFGALGKENISVSIISQGSSERGIGFIVDGKNGYKAKKVLEEEFQTEFQSKDVSQIYINENVSVISIIGQSLHSFNQPYSALIKNHITPILINNTVTGENVCLVVKKTDLKKAVNVIHGEIFGVSKNINIAIFGKGLVGGTLVDQILKSKENILKRKNINLNIFAVANSSKVLLNKDGVTENWKEDLALSNDNNNVETIIDYVNKYHLENLIAVDNTASSEFVKNYIDLVESGFDLVSSNKIANTLDYGFYKELRQKLKENKKAYLYETNVGAGLPLIDTIKLLHDSGENITGIRGVFSGSLSYLFNNFSVQDRPFSQVLKEAIENGYTEPDPREDLCGNDVGRKLLILARELDLQNEFKDVIIQNLIPENLREGSAQEFLGKLEEMDAYYQKIKDNQEAGHVLRYIGDLSGDLQKDKGVLEVKLISVPANSALGQIQGADAIFEVFTESYGEKPIVIQGAGAGAAVTARGVFGDILRLAEKH
ncbi:bifunctional aspartate kinase/homoserine dehydrogenase I [Lutibacter sp. HS1-25]|uniref:bifunctional aspartate kinase/homoserine dehydrogenase I n=1 Tax=Lutibacter sp. HS1-25 TaxID=2485000 RepID=UPI001013BFDA|nr:bifunctional aspartate kinase/homoserine dehydrogenase I [Lutibacter sp. HS1-25]RXP55493.1 bifunctional aspartate kinase/homoserine dehydrogenase I [Lutibacter sp. HS1-25]